VHPGHASLIGFVRQDDLSEIAPLVEVPMCLYGPATIERERAIDDWPKLFCSDRTVDPIEGGAEYLLLFGAEVE
jgi:hypothetical protein